MKQPKQKDFQEQYLASLAANVGTKWLNKRYADVDLAALEADFKQYEKFAPVNNDVNVAYTKLKPFVSNCRIYDQGKKAVNSPYVAEDVAAITPKVKAIRDAATDPANKQDIAELFSQLNYYKVTVQIFQDLIKSIDAVVEGQAVALPLVTATLKKSQEDVDEIQKIPWLKQQYDLYYAQLQKDCKNHAKNKARQTILDLIP